MVLLFVVNKDGSISNVGTESSDKYGMQEQSIKFIKDGPKWTPAKQNGIDVNTYRRQPITFIVKKE